MIKHKKLIISAKKQNLAAIAHFVLRSKRILTSSGETSRFGLGVMAETERFTTAEFLFEKFSNETELYSDLIDIAPSALALAAIAQALDTFQANAGFRRSLYSGKRMALRGLSYCNEGFAIKPFVLLPRPAGR